MHALLACNSFSQTKGGTKSAPAAHDLAHVFAGTRKLASHEVGLNFHHLFETRGLKQLARDLEGGLHILFGER
jgi:hypothetical protein